jgi:hypothetical protein
MLNHPAYTGYKVPRKRIFLDVSFRNWVFGRAYSEAGSLTEIARIFGYIAKSGRNGGVRDMWLGKKPIPYQHLMKLAHLAGVDFVELEAHIIKEGSNSVQNDWLPAMRLLQNYPKISYLDFSERVDRVLATR